MSSVKRPRPIPTPPPPTSPEPGSFDLLPNRHSKNLLGLSRSTSAPTVPRRPKTIHRLPPSALAGRVSVIAAMEAIVIPADNVPLELKACEQILKRARELKKAEPIVAYWCCFSAAQKALKVPNRSQEGTKFLLSLLDCLEQMKALLETQEAIVTEAAGAAYVENFALKVFMSADNDDRNGVTGKATIRKFVVAGQFIEVLRCFENGMTEEMEQKLQYARWKAADGAKALREGREPASGPPIPELDLAAPPSGSPDSGPSTLHGSPPRTATETTPLVVGQKEVSPVLTPTIVSPRPSPSPARPKLPDIDTRNQLGTPKRNHSSGSGAWSTVATPGLPDDDDEPRRFDSVPSAPPPAAVGDGISPPISPVGGDKKNVRFMGPDGAPLSPARTYVSVDSVPPPVAPPPTTFSASPPRSPVLPSAPASRPRGDSGASASTAPRPFTSVQGDGRPRGNSSASNRSNGLNGTGGGANAQGNGARGSPRSQLQPPPPPPPSLASVPPAKAPPPSFASAPPTIPPPAGAPNGGAGGGLGLTAGPPAPSAPAAAAPVELTRKQVEQAQKHAKWAISALDYDDYDTAKEELRKALGMLGA